MELLANFDTAGELRSLRRRIGELRARLGKPGLMVRDEARKELAKLREAFRLLRSTRKETGELQPFRIDPGHPAGHSRQTRRQRNGYVNRGRMIHRSRTSHR